MANNWLDAVFERSRLTGERRLVMLALADRANRDSGECSCGAEDIRQRCGFSSASQVRRAVKKCEDSGELVVVRGGGRSNLNIYRISIPERGATVSNPPVESKPERGATVSDGNTRAQTRAQTSTKHERPERVMADYPLKTVAPRYPNPEPNSSRQPSTQEPRGNFDSKMDSAAAGETAEERDLRIAQENAEIDRLQAAARARLEASRDRPQDDDDAPPLRPPAEPYTPPATRIESETADLAALERRAREAAQALEAARAEAADLIGRYDELQAYKMAGAPGELDATAFETLVARTKEVGPELGAIADDLRFRAYDAAKGAADHAAKALAAGRSQAERARFQAEVVELVGDDVFAGTLVRLRSGDHGATVAEVVAEARRLNGAIRNPGGWMRQKLRARGVPA